jgi:hypothetical protein
MGNLLLVTYCTPTVTSVYGESFVSHVLYTYRHLSIWGIICESRTVQNTTVDNQLSIVLNHPSTHHMLDDNHILFVKLLHVSTKLCHHEGVNYILKGNY